MIWKLLRKNISIAQILGYALANLVGLAIVLSAIKFYGDVSAALGIAGSEEETDGTIAAKDYLVISRPVSMLSTFGMGSSNEGISDEDIADLRSQPWAKSVGEFTSANFSVTGSVDFHGQGMWTYLFLEAVPNEFLDINPSDWHFDPSDPNAEVPIIISKDYLALYNYGFAPSRGMPQLSEGLISKVPIKLYLNGNGYANQYDARIVGFSSRLNTIAVPEEFMKWANDRYSSTPLPKPSRLIVEVNPAGDPEIHKYLKRHDFEVAGDRLDQGKTQYFLTLITSIVITVGVVICALALFILMLSITLLMQKNKEKNSGLLLLGYSPSQVSACYFKLVGIVNAVILVLSIAAMLVASSLWELPLRKLGLEPASPMWAITWGVVIMLAITAVNFVSISRSVKKAF